jgi:hypothetical protein
VNGFGQMLGCDDAVVVFMMSLLVRSPRFLSIQKHEIGYRQDSPSSLNSPLSYVRRQCAIFHYPWQKGKAGSGINNQQQWQKFVNQTTAQMRLQLHREWRKGDP